MTEVRTSNENQRLTLSDSAWVEFTNRLAQPPTFKPKLAALMNREAIWADEDSR